MSVVVKDTASCDSRLVITADGQIAGHDFISALDPADMEAWVTLLLTQYHASDGPLYSWIVFPPSTTIP